MNKFQLYLSLMTGVIPYERLNARANIFLSYGHMYLAPLIYFICFGIVVFGSLGFNELENCGTICRLGNSLFIYMGFCMYVLVHMSTLWRRKEFFIEFEKSVKVIDDCLNKCDKVGAVKSKAKESKKFKYNCTWFVVIVIFTLVTGFEIMELMHFFGKYFLILVIVSSFPYFACSIVMGQFVHYVSEILKRLSKLNELFNRIHHEADRKHIPVMIFNIETEIQRDIPINQELRQRHNADYTMTTANNNELNFEDYGDVLNDTEPHAPNGPSSEKNLPELFKIHDNILRLCVLANGEFGSQCIPYMTACFIITVLAIFLQAKVFVHTVGKNRKVDYVALVYFFWSLATMLVSYLVLRLCAIVIKHSKESVLIVHEIMQKKPAFMLTNDAYYNKMKSFTLQYLHWERYFQFNSLGLYVLDYTFIFAGICAATSYLIVLLQFDMTTTLKSEGLL